MTHPSPLSALLLTAGALLVALLAANRMWSSDESPMIMPPKAALELKPIPAGESRTVVLAGGCFWCEEAVFEQLKGVSAVVAGYAGGTAETANYDHYTESNHAEAVRITFDPAAIGFTDLIRALFAAGDPTVKDGQNPDFGHQYRMAVFYQTDEEKQVAEAYIAQVDQAKVYAKPLAVTVEPMPHGFFPAEEHHQHYVENHTTQPYCSRFSLAKIRRIRALFADQLKPVEQSPAASAAAAQVSGR
jgi:peptide-methionine (S)-S-oxide reductase